MASPVPDRPGLLIRDPFQYSDATLIIPPPLVEFLQFFDGETTSEDLRHALFQLTGDLRVGELEEHLVQTLGQAGFFMDDTFERLRTERHKCFSDATQRLPAHAGSAYPEEADELRITFDRYMAGQARPTEDSLIGIAAPHVSPEGGWGCYQAAYRALSPQYRDKTFVILGTSHYGQPERFGLTSKPFLTPLGEAITDQDLVRQLAGKAAGALEVEDYCHAVEHSIEFQVVFLQHVFGPDIRILPILCGAYAKSIYVGGMPEDDPDVALFLAALGDLAERERDRLFWVLGVDMAHMGRRYGDEYAVRAGDSRMSEVAELDTNRIASLARADAGAFWDAVQQDHDPLKWCGASPFYTFLKAVPNARGDLLKYEQWNIDDESVVTFGGMVFRR